ncbi:MAG: N-acetylmuramoyl-L-alanine amidase [Waterburya sp.]
MTDLMGKQGLEENWDEIDINFPDLHFFRTIQKKRQIVLHHTEGNPNGLSSIQWWRTRNQGRGTVATPYLVDEDGVVLRLFPSYFWANALGKGFAHLDRSAVQIELCSYGYLQKTKYGFLDDVAVQDFERERIKRGLEFASRRLIPESEVVQKDFRWGTYFARYTDDQIDTTVKLIRYLSERYDIPVKFNYEDMFDVSRKAINGVPGLYTHASFRSDKLDLCPQDHLIEKLKHYFP